MLTAGFAQAIPFLGEPVTIGPITATGFVSPTNDRLTFQILGYLEECDVLCTLNLSDWQDAPPTANEQVVYGGRTYVIRGIKTDRTAYVLGLKMIDPATTVNILITFTMDNIVTFDGVQMIPF